jgi:hypothetical protein
MQKISKFIAAVASGLAGTCGVAMAAPVPVPEPTSIALAAAGIVGAVYFARKGK